MHHITMCDTSLVVNATEGAHDVLVKSRIRELASVQAAAESSSTDHSAV